ncbi:MAG: lytic murein transglycosylase B [Gammaproteobacteria bacterium]|jgi:membrane-bound lytic murein transglycosylase B|nr:lytic murein transglycosylase B [Gammaproteobacteria bacterium]
MLKKTVSLQPLVVFILCLLSPALSLADLSARSDVREFIDDMNKKHGFKEGELLKVFAKVDINQKIIDAITRPAEAKPWHEYRPIFLTEKRINGGVEFWKQNDAALSRAYKDFGVNPEIIVAIIGVESLYGKYRGRYSVLESLSTLAFNYPKRSRFFKSELEQFLLLAREENIDPEEIKGSYAGAMGKPQFISSSFRRYAVDFDNDGKRDLWGNSVDVIGSVANYFAEHNWRKGQPVASKAKVNGNGYKALVKKGIRPHMPLGDMLKKGISIADDFPTDEKAALIELENKDGEEYWVGMDNFYVITRYNHSQLYAMAVYQLSKAIKEKRQTAVAVTE